MGIDAELSTADMGIDEVTTGDMGIDEVSCLLLICALMKWLSTVDMGIYEVTIYCWYGYWWSNYLLLIWVLMK